MKTDDFDNIIGFILLLIGATAIIKIIDEATRSANYKCPRCKIDIKKGQNPCPNCYSPIRWKI